MSCPHRRKNEHADATWYNDPSLRLNVCSWRFDCHAAMPWVPKLLLLDLWAKFTKADVSNRFQGRNMSVEDYVMHSKGLVTAEDSVKWGWQNEHFEHLDGCYSSVCRQSVLGWLWCGPRATAGAGRLWNRFENLSFTEIWNYISLRLKSKKSSCLTEFQKI